MISDFIGGCFSNDDGIFVLLYSVLVMRLCHSADTRRVQSFKYLQKRYGKKICWSCSNLARQCIISACTLTN